MRIVHLSQRWAPLSIEGADLVSTRMSSILASWENTKYLSGQKCKGVGADCIGFACSVLDELDGRARAQSPSLPADTALHSPGQAYKSVAALRRIYAPARRLRWSERELEPGDLLVVGTALGGPGHMMIVGPVRNTIWHASNGAGRVHQAGWVLGDGYERLFAAYRLEDRYRWLEAR